MQPSVVPQTLPHFRPPREMTKEEIRRTIRDHVICAELSIRAGFDGVELTSFMGYLLANFNSQFTNKRSDEYGGSVENRGRFMRELITEVKQAIGDDNLLIVRLNGAELMDQWGGCPEDECFELMHQAAACGIDMISVTVGWQEAPESSIGRDVEPGHWNRLAARAKAELPDMPIAFGVRLPDPVMADECLAKGEFDFWEVCRPLLADPEMVHKAAEDRLDERKRCIGSLNCLSRMFRDLPYWCTMNPVLGHEVEPEYHITPAAVSKRVMVVGAGPAGIECAIAASRRGHDVTIYDRAERIGGSLLGYARNDLAHPEDLMSIVSYYETMVGKHAIKVCLNTEIDSKFMRGVLHEFDVVVAAVGAKFHMEALPIEDGAGERVLDAHEVALGKHAVSGRVVVLGGGKVGLTIAESLTSKGCDVTVLERDRRIGGDVAPTWKWRHTAWIEEMEIKVVTECVVKSIRNDAVDLVNSDGEAVTMKADFIIAASPERPDQGLFRQLEWMVDELHGCGDALVSRGLGQAIHDGYRLGCRL
ncbi:MAG: oxidoreductase, partial [Alphaproteobacteria bacterium]